MYMCTIYVWTVVTNALHSACLLRPQPIIVPCLLHSVAGICNLQLLLCSAHVGALSWILILMVV